MGVYRARLEDNFKAFNRVLNGRKTVGKFEAKMERVEVAEICSFRL